MAFGALRGMFGMGGGRQRTPGGPQGAFGQQVFKQKPPMNQGGNAGPFGNMAQSATQQFGGPKPPNQMNQGGGFGRALQQGGQMNGPMGPKPPMQGGMQPIQQMPNKPPWMQGGGGNVNPVPYNAPRRPMPPWMQGGISENGGQTDVGGWGGGVIDRTNRGAPFNPAGQGPVATNPEQGMDFGNMTQGGIGPSIEQIQQQWNQDPRMQNFRSPMEGGYAPPWMQS